MKYLYVGRADPFKHAYFKKLNEQIAEGKIKGDPGEVEHIHIFHDDGCGIFSGGCCDCEPEIEIRREGT